MYGAHRLASYDTRVCNIIVGSVVYARDTHQNWGLATVLEQKSASCLIHYINWPKKWNEWLPNDSPRLRPVWYMSKNQGSNYLHDIVGPDDVFGNLKYYNNQKATTTTTTTATTTIPCLPDVKQSIINADWAAAMAAQETDVKRHDIDVTVHSSRHEQPYHTTAIKHVLSTHSGYFRAMLSGRFAEKEETAAVIVHFDFESPEHMASLFHYFYTGVIDVTANNYRGYLNISSFFQIDSLRATLEKSNVTSEFSPANVFSFLSEPLMHPEADRLTEAATQYVADHLDAVMSLFPMPCDPDTFWQIVITARKSKHCKLDETKWWKLVKGCVLRQCGFANPSDNTASFVDINTAASIIRSAVQLGRIHPLELANDSLLKRIIPEKNQHEVLAAAINNLWPNGQPAIFNVASDLCIVPGVPGTVTNAVTNIKNAVKVIDLSNQQYTKDLSDYDAYPDLGDYPDSDSD
jgi:hypothetical protein